MDAFDFAEEKPKRPPRNTSALIWNVLTALVLAMTACVAGVFILFFTNPTNAFNPYPPPTMVAVVGLPTATVTSQVQLPATWTPPPRQEPTETPTLLPSSTPIPTFTPFGLPSATPNQEATLTPGGYAFVVKKGNQDAISSETLRPGDNCKWMGVVGQVFDLRGAPVPGQFVYLGGTLAGGVIPEQPTITGLLLQYGRGYFEFKLADMPVPSKGTLWLQVRDQAGLVMSDKYYFDTYETCEKNMVVVNFQQVK
jgi:hypothetical protein